ncbi:MAG: O-antigen ligase family protein, partial [Dokdonella sp.]
SERAPQTGDHALFIAAAALLVLCFVFGGDSATGNLGMMAAQMLAIPLLIFGALRAGQRGHLHSARWSVVVALLIALLPLLQLLPIPVSIWLLPAERISLLQDLHIAGVASVDHRWTLSPSVTERDFYFLLPGLALFFCMLGLGRTAWRRMLGLLVVVCLANLALGFAQVVAGQESFLNPYPDFAPALAGVFANRNHQADLLAIGLMLVAVFVIDNWKKARDGQRSFARVGALALVGMILILALPVVGSRAGVIVAMIMLMAALLTSGLPSWRSFRRKPIFQVAALVTLLIFGAGLQAARAWMQADVGVEGSRHTLMTETVRIGREHSPLGSGVGTFVPAFQQGGSDAVPLDAYVNNAHNEYAQWWLEAGIAGVLLTLFSLAVLIAALIALLRQRPESTTRVVGMAAMMGIGVMVLHSTVDYPLRTQAMSAIFGILAGIAIAAATSRTRATEVSRAEH